MRKDRKARQQNSGKNAMYIGIICLILAAIYGLAYFAVFEAGPLVFANMIQVYLFGKLSFLLPLLLLVIGWRLLFAASVSLINKKTMALFMVMLCLLGTAHHILVPIKEELYPEHLKAGAGLVGGLVSWIMHNLLGDSGTDIFFVCIWLLVIGFVMPWKKIFSAFRNSSKGSARTRKGRRTMETTEQKTKVEEKPVKRTTSTFRTDSGSSSVTDAYSDSEFDSFQDGIKKTSAIRRIFTVKDDNIYEQEDIKEEIQKDPVNVPEWAERPSQQVIIRPKINYGDEPVAMPERHFLDEQAPSPEPPRAEAKDEVGGLFVNNTRNRQPSVKEETASCVFVSREKGESMFSDVESAEEKQDDKTKAASSVSEGGNAAYEAAEAEPRIAIYDSSEKVGNVSASAVSQVEAASDYKFPPMEMLNIPKTTSASAYEQDIMQQCAILEQTLADFRVRAKVIAVTRGPSVTRFELEPAPGVKVSSVVNLADDIALRLAAPGVRIEAPIPGKSAIGIEAPNTKNDTVCFREVVDNDVVRSSTSSLCIGLGKDISGNIIPADLSKMPHLLVAGSTGSGKSVCINTIIAGILYKARPDDVKLILVDPKVVELSNYNGIPHLLTPVVTEPKKAASALHWAVAEMERRYQTFADNHVRDINSFNAQAPQKMPFIVIIIDELSDLMMVAKVDVEDAILRLAQKARAAGIHLILATQRPSVDVITGIVKANIPSRIAFAVSSQTDSRTIIDMGGAEKLLGKGDMLFYPIGMNKPVRVQGAFVSDAELNRIVDFIIKQSIPVNYTEEVTEQELECDNKGSAQEAGHNNNMNAEDELFEDAVKLVLDMGQASSSMLQRRFRIGYTRAARLVDTMEEMGIVGQAVGSKPREVIMSRQEVEERFLNKE